MILFSDDNDSGLSCSQSLTMNNLSLNNNLNEDFNGQFDREKCFPTSIDSTECDKSQNSGTKDASAAGVEFPYLGTDHNQNLQDVTQVETNSENSARISVYDTLYSRRRGIVPRTKRTSKTKTKLLERELASSEPKRTRSTSFESLKAQKSNAEHLYMNLPCREECFAESEVNWYGSDSPPLAMSTPYGSDQSPTNRSQIAVTQGKANPSQTKTSALELNEPSGSITIPRSNLTRQWSSESQTDVHEFKDMYRLVNNRTKLEKDVQISPIETPPNVSPLNLSSQILHQHDPDDDTDQESSSDATKQAHFLSKEEISEKTSHIWSHENENKSK